MTATAPVAMSFGFIDRRVMAAVERVAGTDPDPGDPFRGLYISDEVALRLSQGESGSDADERLKAVIAALGLDLLEAAVLAVCAATELNPRYGRLYAYLQDDVTRKLPSPRLVGQLLEGEGLTPADVMAAFDADGRLRHLGALKLLGDAQTPLAERPVKVADRLAAALLRGRMDEAPQPTRLRIVALPAHDPGREESVQMIAALLARASKLPIVLAGPDADSLLATALGRPLVAAHVRDLPDREVMSEAALIGALESRPLIFEGLEDIEPGERARLLRAIEHRRERTIIAAPNRTAALALGERTVLLVEAASPSFAERRQAWADLTGSAATGDVAAKFRLSMTQIVEAAEVARLSATARGLDAPEPADLDLGARQGAASRGGGAAPPPPPGAPRG